MAVASSLVVLWLLAGPDAGAKAPLASVAGVAAPLGRIGDVVGPSPEGGLPAVERVWVGTLDGCGREQSVNLSRFLLGAAEGAVQTEAWLRALDKGGPLQSWKRLAPHLVETVRAVRAAVPTDVAACAPLPPPDRTDGWKLATARAPGRLCPTAGASAAQPKVYAFTVPRKGRSAPRMAAWVVLEAAPAERSDRCRPRLSTVMFGPDGKARFAYHADFGGELSVEVLDGPCRRLELAFDSGRQEFLPRVHEGGLGCGKVRR